MVRYVIYSVLFASFAASALTLDEFAPVHKARVERKGANVEGCLAHPLIVGCHWFQYRDQPLLGRGDGEAYQIGFVDVCDRPYPELTRAARKLGAELYEKRAKGAW